MVIEEAVVRKHTDVMEVSKKGNVYLKKARQ